MQQIPETPGSILDAFARTAAQYGSQTAVSDGELALTWAQLYRESSALAARLCRMLPQGAGVAVLAERRTETLVLFLAALCSGCCYIPLDPEMPPQRLAHIQQNARFSVALGCGPRPAALAEQIQWVPYAYEGAGERPLSDADQALLAQRQAQISAASPLYLVYTSGSTGIPKGVVKSHGAMQSFATAFLREYPLAPADILGNQTPFFFDASAKDLYWCLYTGCRMEIIPTKLFSFPIRLVQYLNEKKVTVISWVPSALAIVSQLNTFDTILPQTLRAVYFVGEVFPVRQLMRWRRALPHLLMVNLYGSSELAGVCCHYRIDRDLNDADPLPIGYPLPHCKVTLRTPAGEVLRGPGQEGELCIESPALADGYYGDPQRTAEVFRTEAAADGSAHRVLHSGDLAAYGPNGELIFTSRRDFQIKHMGYRIELGEIEAEVNALDCIAQCACIYDAQRSRIVLFAQPADPALTTADLTALLRKRLCHYMVPQRIQFLDAIPHNRNGKIDRVSLQQLYLTTARRRGSSK